MKIVTETRQEEENRSEKSSRVKTRDKAFARIDRGEKIFRRPFRLGSRVGNSCFSSKYIGKQLDSNRSLKSIAINKVTPRLFITAKTSKMISSCCSVVTVLFTRLSIFQNFYTSSLCFSFPRSTLKKRRSKSLGQFVSTARE